MTKNRPLGRKEGIVVQELDGEVLIYDLRADKAFCLNPTSALIWRLCDGDKNVADISEQVAKQFNSNSSEDLVWLALDQLKKENLIENANDLPSNFLGMSRREVVKKIGLGSIVALPIVMSLVAPQGVHAAASCMTVIAGCTCTPGQPAGTNCTANGMITMACAAMNCNCYQNPGSPADDCKP